MCKMLETMQHFRVRRQVPYCFVLLSLASDGNLDIIMKYCYGHYSRRKCPECLDNYPIVQKPTLQSNHLDLVERTTICHSGAQISVHLFLSTSLLKSFVMNKLTHRGYCRIYRQLASG